MLAAFAALLLLADGPVTLDWRAPDGCPGRDAVLAALAGLGAADDGAAPAPRVRATARTRRVGELYELDLRIQTASVALRRRLVTDDCATLAEATALLVAIVVDPLEVTAQVTGEPAEPLSRMPDGDLPLAVVAREPAPSPAPPPSPSPGATPRARVRAPAPARASALVRLDAAIDAGATPRIAGDVGGALGLARARLRIELHGLYTAAQALSFGTARVGRLARWAVGARACARVLQRRLEIPLCLGLEGGQFLASGAGVTLRPRDARPPWLAALVGLGLVWAPHPRIGLGARAELVVAPLRAQFTVGGEVVHVADPLGLRVALGVELRLGPGARTRARLPADGIAASRPRP